MMRIIPHLLLPALVLCVLPPVGWVSTNSCREQQRQPRLGRRAPRMDRLPPPVEEGQPSHPCKRPILAEEEDDDDDDDLIRSRPLLAHAHDTLSADAGKESGRQPLEVSLPWRGLSGVPLYLLLQSLLI